MSICQPLKLLDPRLVGTPLDAFWKMDIVGSGALSDGIVSSRNDYSGCHFEWYRILIYRRNFETGRVKRDWLEGIRKTDPAYIPSFG